MIGNCCKGVMETIMDEGMIVRELFNQMKKNPELAGSYELINNYIVWHLFNRYPVIVTAMYIGIFRRRRFCHIIEPIYHWHPDNRDIYSDVCRLGTRGNMTVIHQLNPWGSYMLYSGPRSNCPDKEELSFGKNIYLYAGV